LPGKILSFLVKLVFGLSALIVGMGLLALAMVMVAFSLLRALVTGRKPASAFVFSRFQGFPASSPWSGVPTHRPAADSVRGEVVDVEMREVREVRELPDARNDKNLPR